MPLRRPRLRNRYTDTSRRATRRVRFEPLEPRMMLTGLPYGAVGPDTAEYMLGSVVATVVFFESNGSIDPNTEDWNPQKTADTKGRIAEGMQWWEDALVNFYATNYVNVEPVHSLDFILDFHYADNPVATGYEPISRLSQEYPKWVADFLRQAGYLATGSIDTDIRTFNNAQRLNNNADWAFTIFVANDYNDSDGLFAPGSQFSQAFSFSGGRFLIAPAQRPASTFAHETGHIFYARDEYQGSGSVLHRSPRVLQQPELERLGQYDPRFCPAAESDEFRLQSPNGLCEPHQFRLFAGHDRLAGFGRRRGV